MLWMEIFVLNVTTCAISPLVDVFTVKGPKWIRSA